MRCTSLIPCLFLLACGDDFPVHSQSVAIAKHVQPLEPDGPVQTDSECTVRQSTGRQVGFFPIQGSPDLTYSMSVDETRFNAPVKIHFWGSRSRCVKETEVIDYFGEFETDIRTQVHQQRTVSFIVPLEDQLFVVGRSVHARDGNLSNPLCVGHHPCQLDMAYGQDAKVHFSIAVGDQLILDHTFQLETPRALPLVQATPGDKE